jgi:hypothetical protein
MLLEKLTESRRLFSKMRHIETFHPTVRTATQLNFKICRLSFTESSSSRILKKRSIVIVSMVVEFAKSFTN